MNITDKADKKSIIQEKLKELKQSENLSDEEIDNIELTINKFCSMIYDFLVLNGNPEKSIQISTNPQKMAA